MAFIKIYIRRSKLVHLHCQLMKDKFLLVFALS